MNGPTALIYGVLIPAAVAGIVLMLCGRGSGEVRPARAFIGALAFGVGWLIAYRFIVGMPDLPGSTVQIAPHAWLAWFVLAAIALAPLRDIESLRRWSNPFYAILFSIISFRFPLANVLENDVSGIAIRFGLTLVMYMAWNASDSLATRVRGPALPAAWMISGVGVALCSLFAHVALFAQLAGALTAALGAAAVVGLIDRGTRFADGAIAIMWLVFAGALINAGIYDLSRVSIALLVVAMLAPWVVTRKSFAGRPLVAAGVAMLAAALPTAIAVWIAYEPTPY
ncbi:MAG: hypothetical protein SGI72_16725 [Planctomycetota bacterium]|nr:hypothetical protein [Planctomycetota bacterium]